MDILKNGVKYGPAIGFLIYVIASWTTYNISINNLRETQDVQAVEIEKIRDNYDTLLRDVSAIKEDTSSIKTSIKYIERNI